MKFDQVSFEHLLGSVLKPSRYIDHEINSFHNYPDPDKINFCLLFPDVYEVGFSHLGIKILYSIINKQADSTADRAYVPWPDLGELLQQEKIPLFGLESKVKLKDFDVVGITLQSELTFTNILYSLELAQIPQLAVERQENDPIVLAGGPVASNPEPMSDFIDCFLIGDGEQAILEIKDVLLANKAASRHQKIIALSQVEGVYAPHIMNNHSPKKIKARKFMQFNDPNYLHDPQLLPWTEPTHYRYVSEIMRGCSRGCRFCHAGMFYRPVRERDPELIIDTLLQEVKRMGWSEVALTSLSSSDYSCIKPLLLELFNRLSDLRVSISLPSLRVDSLDEDIVRLLNALRQTGLTIAPEAGSQRLREIINKNLTEVEILEGVDIAVQNGWKVIKLYFMIGLPFETDTDIEAIIDLVNKIIAITGKRLQINVTLSPFVPKNFTPFQWAGMDNAASLLKKATLIKEQFKRQKFIKISYHDVNSSFLECLLGRGGREVGKIILKAYKAGAKFDGWREYFDASIWQKVISDSGFERSDIIAGIDLDETLPWDHIDLGISKKFLQEEWKKASESIQTEDCRDGNCSSCGICSTEIQPMLISAGKQIDLKLPEPPAKVQFNNNFYRIYYAKMGDLRFVAHLDFVRMAQNFLRVSKLPLIYTQGFNIHLKLNFGPPLPIGVEGLNEYFDIALSSPLPVQEISSILAAVMPKELNFKEVSPITSKAQKTMEYYPWEEIEIFPTAEYLDVMRTGTEKFLASASWPFSRIRKGKTRESDLKDLIASINFKDGKLQITKKLVGASTFDILKEIFGIERDSTGQFRIIRKELLHTL